MADVNEFSSHVSKTWHEDTPLENVKDRYSVNLEGPVVELSLDNVVAPHLDSFNMEEATKTMLDRTYVANVYLVLCYRTFHQF